jgi:hypothetical protein
MKGKTMKHTFFHTLSIFLLLISAAGSGAVRGQTPLEYYLPGASDYDKSVPKPKDVLGFEVGEFYVTSDQILHYLRVVEAASPRVKLFRYGQSHEKRPLYVAVITSPENQKNLEKVKAEHLKLSDPSVSDTADTSKLPVFTWLGHSIHGSEASGANAAVLLIYHLAAAQDKETLKQLEESVIFVDPLLNPDGYNRFTEWHNHNKSFVPNDDLGGGRGGAPNGRGNHYGFDLNRDWLNVQQPESQGRIAALIEWRPNVYTDAHEQGSGANYHFSPGIPTQIHPLIPPKAQDFIKRLAKEFYAPAFDDRGVLYFSGENFDDYYPGRGREYLDFHGGIAILWEQPSSGEFVTATPNGPLTLEFAILNQLTAGLATVKGGHALRKELLDYQKEYFKQALAEAEEDPVKAYVFGSQTDRAAAFRLAELAVRNNIEVYRLKNDLVTGGKTYKAESSYVVPVKQTQRRLVHAVFEIREKYDSPRSYDITGWTLPFAFNLDYSLLGEEVKAETAGGDDVAKGDASGGQRADAASRTGLPSREPNTLPLVAGVNGQDNGTAGSQTEQNEDEATARRGSRLQRTALPSSGTKPGEGNLITGHNVASLIGGKVTLNDFPKGKPEGDAKGYAYLFNWDGYYAPRALYRLLDKEIRVKSLTAPFTAADGRIFERDTFVILTGSAYQKKSSEEIEAVIKTILEEDGIDVYSLKTGYTEGHRSLGSGGLLRNVETKPRIAIIGSGGAVWHLFDQHYKIPVTIISPENFDRADLSRYNVIFLNGNLTSDSDAGGQRERITGAEGIPPAAARGTAKLRAWVEAGNTLIGYDNAVGTFVRAGLLNAEVSSGRANFLGITFQTQADLSSPLLLGYRNSNIPVFKDGGIVLSSADKSGTLLSYTEEPLLSGNISSESVKAVAGKPVLVTGRAVRGVVIGFAFDPQFRAVWYGTNKLTANAVFWGGRLGGQRGGQR